MSPNTSFIPPNVAPPDPPEARVIALVFSIFMSVVLLLFVGFVSIDFLADIAGYPLFAPKTPSHETPIILPDQDTREYLLVTPKHQTRIFGPEVVVIYTQCSPNGLTRIPDMWLNDVQLPWDMQYGDNTWFARLELKAGQYHLRVAESEADFFVETLDSAIRSPEPWAWYRPHPGTDQIDTCDNCHKMTTRPADILAGRGGTIGAWQGRRSCFACHKEEYHEGIHYQVRPTPYQCTGCHVMH
jgi:hypothetical protein